MRPLYRLSLCALYPLWVACIAEPREPEGQPVQVEVVEALVVDLEREHQRITGFGASSAWTAPFLTEDMAEQFFSVESGLGLSLLRIQIHPEGSTFELGTVDAAVAYGVKVWASPWSPPKELKTNDSTRGGALKPEGYMVWANTLARFAASMAERGTPLLGISPQNEPDYDAQWDSCVYTPAELARFVTENFAPALEELAPEVGIVAPESANWDTFGDYANPLLDEPAVLKQMLAVATHDYGGAEFELGRARELGQEVWMTEMSDANQNPDPGMNSALSIAVKIQVALTRAQVSAWHYWWLLPRTDNGIGDTNAALTDPQLRMTKRAYALGHYSRFIRPGFVRLGTNAQWARQVVGSAFRSPDSTTLVVVLVSDRSGALEQKIQVPGLELTSAELWVTDKQRSLERSGDAPEITRARDGDGVELHVTLPPNSVVTVVSRTGGAIAPAPARYESDAAVPVDATPGVDAAATDASAAAR
jgi:glucuronoarabinoxylan endo-1,4-beta-xylanase